MKRRALLTLLLVGALGAADATAASAKVYRGRTAQGRPASVVIGSDGLLRTARVNWRARCRHGRVTEKTSFLRPHDFSQPGAFRDSGTYRVRQSGGVRLRMTAYIRGALDRSLDRWSGIFSAKVLVTRYGRYVDTCRVRDLHWRARPA